MKVVCDNCRAVYKIPDAKLVKPINKATCRNCGYRMLIPRPPATADSDFSTLVTAVPPTPMGAPPREKSTSTIEVEPAEGTGDSTEVINKKEESTKPGDQKVVDDDMLLLPDTPSQDPSQRENDSSESVPDDSFLGAEEDTRVTEISKHSFSSGDTVKAPSPLRTQPSNAPAAYDPSGDLTIAIIGTLGAMVGTFPMAALVFSPNPFLLWFGQAVAFGGATTALLILLTGGRGTRPASRVVSLLIGASLAVVVASIVTGVKLSAEHIDWAELSSTGAAIEAPATPEQDAPTVNEAPSPEGDEPTGTEEATDTPDEDAPSEDDEGPPMSRRLRQRQLPLPSQPLPAPARHRREVARSQVPDLHRAHRMTTLTSMTSSTHPPRPSQSKTKKKTLMALMMNWISMMILWQT